MNRVAKVEDNNVVAFPVNLRTEFPNMSFPVVVKQEDLPGGYFVLVPTPKPAAKPGEPVFEGKPVFEDGVVKQQWIVMEKDLDGLKSVYIQKIEDDAEAERLKYITKGEGQSMSYTEKARQAREYRRAEAAGEPIVESDYFLIMAEVGITKPTLAEMVELVENTRDGWGQIEYAIERTRQGVKKNIRDALDRDAVISAYNAATWPSQGV